MPWNFPGATIRQAALRPVVFAYLDGRRLIFSRRELAMNWRRLDKERAAIEKTDADDGRLALIIDWARKLHAQYIVLDEPRGVGELAAGGAECIWTSERYSLLKLKARE